MEVIIKKFEHINRSFSGWDTPHGKHVKNKDHYDRLMKEGNYIAYEEGLEKDKNNGNKPYVLSKNGWDIIKAAKSTKDKKGIVKLSGRTLDALREIGAIDKKIAPYMKISSMDSGKGGFIK